MNIFRNQNEKMLEETLAGSNSDVVKNMEKFTLFENYPTPFVSSI